MRNFLIVVALVLMVGVSSASADSITYTLTTTNLDPLTYPGSYGTVTIDLTSATTADVTFNGLSNDLFTYLLGMQGAVDLNVNGTFSVVGGAEGIVGTNSYDNFAPIAYSIGSGNADGFGSFNLNIDSTKGGFTRTAEEITFTLSNLSGTWTSAANVLTPNAQGEIIAAHIAACTNPCVSTEGNVITGYVAGSTQSTSVTGLTPVPEPATLSLVGAGLALVIRSSRRRQKARAAR